MFGYKLFADGKADAQIISNPPNQASPINDTATSSAVEFPVPWTVRVQTPVRRPSMGKMWGNSEWESYGGPWS